MNFFQTAAATEIALRAHREAEQRIRPAGSLASRINSMIRRYELDGFKGTKEDWEGLVRAAERER